MANIFSIEWWTLVLQSMKTRLRALILGNPLSTTVQLEHRLPILLALPVFASDALSSVAYATDELLIVLAEAFGVGGSSAIAVSYFGIPLPILISLAIGVLLVIVGVSFYQAIQLYPTGGGSYSVARDYLGPRGGLVTAGALTIDYILTVAVSTSAGVAALVSAFPALIGARVYLALGLVAIITLLNLRGTRESGWAFAVPAYAFVSLVGVLIVTTVVKYIASGGQLEPIPVPPGVLEPIHAFAVFTVLRAFANGCAAMTGVEAVADGTSAFKPPEARNAGITLIILISLLAFLFIGVCFSATVYHAQPSHEVTIISQLAEANFGRGMLFFLINFATLAVLMVAANTAFAGFPRLAAIVAKDGYMPKSLTRLGDRLVHTQGILFLTLVSGALIVGFRANVTALIGLYAVGVFLTFTLAQSAVVRRILTLRDKGWQRQMAIALIGATATGIVTVVIAIAKAQNGSWVVLVLIPLLVAIFFAIKRHYEWFDKTMTVHPDDYNPLSEPAEPLTVLVLVSSDIHRGILEGLECGRALAEGHADSLLHAVHIEMDPEKTPRLRAKWAQMVEPFLGSKIKLDVIPSPYRWLVEPVMDYLDWIDLERTGDRVIVVLPEFETGSWLTQFLHNFTAHRLRQALLNRPHITVVSSRFFMKPMAWRLGRGGFVY